MKRKNSVFLLLSFLISLNILAWTAVWEFNKSPFLEVSFFDIGQGDAIFIQTPKKHQILIDGGPDAKILDKLGKEMPFWDRSLDLVILTHPDRDHLAGLLEVLKKYRVENVLWTGVVRDTPELQEWRRLIEKDDNLTTSPGTQARAWTGGGRGGVSAPGRAAKPNIFIAQSGQKIKICNLSRLNPCAFIKILYPFESLENLRIDNINETSIVAKLTFDQNIFLFTGDIPQSVEKRLIDRGVEIDSEILKIAHHGSRASSGEEFLTKASPEIAVISVGRKNRYGHPHPKVLERLSQYGIKVLRTDEMGDIKILSDGENYQLRIEHGN